MNIQHIKASVAAKENIQLPSLMMVRQINQTTQAPEPWLSHWDNDKRVRISIHEDLFKELVADPNMDCLAVKMTVKEKTETTDQYTIYTIIKPALVEHVF